MTSKHTWLTGILTGWGIRESWAKLIAGIKISSERSEDFVTK